MRLEREGGSIPVAADGMEVMEIRHVGGSFIVQAVGLYISKVLEPTFRDPKLKETGNLSAIMNIERHIEYHDDFHKNNRQP